MQTMSYESWEYNMWNVADAERISSAWYFAALVVIGSLFLLNVFIAAVNSVFLRARRENQVRNMVERNKTNNIGLLGPIEVAPASCSF